MQVFVRFEECKGKACWLYEEFYLASSLKKINEPREKGKRIRR
jgi:hypothetical protein